MNSNDNSVETLAKTLWKAFVIFNTVAAFTMPSPPPPSCDVDDIIAENEELLGRLTEALMQVAEFDYSDTLAAHDFRVLLEEIEGCLGGFRYPSKELQTLIKKTRLLVKVMSSQLEKIHIKENLDKEAEHRAKLKRLRAYCKANDLHAPVNLKPSFRLKMLLTIFVLLTASALSLFGWKYIGPNDEGAMCLLVMAFIVPIAMAALFAQTLIRSFRVNLSTKGVEEERD